MKYNIQLDDENLLTTEDQYWETRIQAGHSLMYKDSLYEVTSVVNNFDTGKAWVLVKPPPVGRVARKINHSLKSLHPPTSAEENDMPLINMGTRVKTPHPILLISVYLFDETDLKRSISSNGS